MYRGLPNAFRGKLSEELEDGTYKGSVNVKLGPFTATFEGEASYEPDPELNQEE